MRAGDLVTPVEIQRKETGQGPTGQPVQTWVTVHNTWADIRNISGLQAIKSGIELSSVRTSIRIRYEPDVTAGMRVKYENQVFDIEAVMPDVKYRVFSDLTCKTGANDG